LIRWNEFPALRLDQGGGVAPSLPIEESAAGAKRLVRHRDGGPDKMDAGWRGAEPFRPGEPAIRDQRSGGTPDMATATTTIQEPTASKSLTVSRPEPEAATRVVLEGIRWSTYEALLEDLGDHPTHLTFDDGRLEIMSPLKRHEWSKTLIGRLIETLTEELDIPIQSGGSTTFRKQVRKKGLEPDECYWVAHEPQVRGKEDLDLSEDPPPDIAIEIEISRSALDRMGIYAAIGIPEVWRYDGTSLVVEHLQADRVYRPAERSPSFPWLPLAKLAEHLERRKAIDETRWVREFRAWVRDELSANVPGRAEDTPRA
jgi:Uma2 family endonuclease